MGRVSWVVLGAIIGAAACASRSERLSPPEVPAGAGTRIITLVHDGQTDVRVEEASAELVLEVTIVGAGDPAAEQRVHLPAAVEVAYFAESPAELRLSPGPQQLSVAGGALITAAPLQSWRAELSAQLGNSWSELPWSQLASSRIRLGLSTPCARLEPRVYPLADNMDLPWGVAMSDGRVLAGDPLSGKLLSLGVDGSVIELDRAGLPPELHVESAFADRRGGVWVGAQEGTLWRSPLQRQLSLTRTATIDASTAILRVAGDPEQPEEELYVVSSSGSFARVSHGQVQLLHRFDGRDAGASLIWLGPGHAVAAWADANTIIEVRGAEVRELPPAGANGVIALGSLRDGSWLAARPGGVIEHHHDGQVDQLLQGGLNVSAFQDRPDGFLFAREHGFVRQWVAGFGMCPSEVPLVGGNVLALVEVGAELFVLQKHTSAGGAFAILRTN